VRLLMKTQLNSLEKIAGYQGPVMMSHGDVDEIVPFDLGRQLFDAVQNESKRFVTIDGGFHNDPQPSSYYDELESFLAGLDQ